MELKSNTQEEMEELQNVQIRDALNRVTEWINRERQTEMKECLHKSKYSVVKTILKCRNRSKTNEIMTLKKNLSCSFLIKPLGVSHVPVSKISPSLPWSS